MIDHQHRTLDEQALIALIEATRGLCMTEQEANLALEQARALENFDVISAEALAAAVAKGYAHPKIDEASGKTIYVCTEPFVVLSDNSVVSARERHHDFAK